MKTRIIIKLSHHEFIWVTDMKGIRPIMPAKDNLSFEPIKLERFEDLYPYMGKNIPVLLIDETEHKEKRNLTTFDKIMYIKEIYVYSIES